MCSSSGSIVSGKGRRGSWRLPRPSTNPGFVLRQKLRNLPGSSGPGSLHTGMGWWSPWSSGSKKDPETFANNDSHVEEAEEERKSSIRSSSRSALSSSSASSKKYTDWNSILNATDWAQFKEPRNLIPTILLTSGILFVVHIHHRFLRRIPEAKDISPSYFRRRSLLGWVTSVGDGDNFRMFHTPGGRLAGWGWLPWKKIPTSKKELKDRTVCFF